MLLTVVIPVYNEAESLRELHSQLTATAAEHGFELQIVMVDDGSTDGSWEVIQELATEDARIEGIRFRRIRIDRPTPGPGDPHRGITRICFDSPCRRSLDSRGEGADFFRLAFRS